MIDNSNNNFKVPISSTAGTYREQLWRIALDAFCSQEIQSRPAIVTRAISSIYETEHSGASIFRIELFADLTKYSMWLSAANQIELSIILYYALAARNWRLWDGNLEILWNKSGFAIWGDLRLAGTLSKADQPKWPPSLQLRRHLGNAHSDWNCSPILKGNRHSKCATKTPLIFIACEDEGFVGEIAR